jgi:eukaryotic-like serine/threonine-protein kinase
MSTSNVGQGGRFVPRVGAVVAGKYRIERKLGEGGMGLVVAASHLSLGGQVALKFLSSGDELRHEAVKRFTREAQSVARLKSEHIARVLDIGTVESGAPFIVMELLEGQDLQKFVRKNGPLPIAEAVEFVLQAAEGVAEAHACGIVHRDLKPANLFLSHKADGTPFVRVLDFGIAKNTRANKEAGDVSLTVGNDVLGSPLYMAPEQIRNPKDVDPRADVWSLGAILYRLLTGRAAFEADNPSATLAMIVMEDPTPLRQLRSDAPPELEAVVARCLEKKLDQRFQSVDDLACALLPFAPVRPRGCPWVATVVPPPVVAPSNSLSNESPHDLSQKTNAPSSRPVITAAIAFGLLFSIAVVLVVVVLVVNASNAHEVSQPAGSASSAARPPMVSTVAAEPMTSVGSSSVKIEMPAGSASTQALLAPSMVTPAVKPVKTPKRNDALDDRL